MNPFLILPPFFQIRSSMQESFDNIRKALDIRERLLTRQVEVVLQSSQQTKNKIQFLPENEKDVLHLIRIFGTFNVNVHKFNSDFLSNEDYEEDSVLMNKQLIIDDDESETKRDDDKDKDKAGYVNSVDENANKINESLINIILVESKELIEKPRPTTKGIPKPLKKQSSTSHQLSSSQIDTVKGTNIVGGGGGSKKKFSPLKNLTLNSGTLNLRNITNLTINTNNNCRPTAINSTAPVADLDPLACNNFYNRLINENKLLQRHRHSCCKPLISNAIVSPTTPTSSSTGTTTSTTNTSFKEFSSGIERELMEKMISRNNWEDGLGLAVVDVNGNLLDAKPLKKMDRPKQIQHWLKQIRSMNESELEPPMQNTEMMEISRIKGS